MTEDQISTWIAGLLDGEGSIVLARDCKDGSFFNIKVNISNTNMELLNTIKERLGYGFLSKVSNGAARWSCNHDRARTILTRVFPYLIVKRRRAALALALFNTVGLKDDQTMLVRERLFELWELTKTKRDPVVTSVLSETVPE